MKTPYYIFSFSKAKANKVFLVLCLPTNTTHDDKMFFRTRLTDVISSVKATLEAIHHSLFFMIINCYFYANLESLKICSK